MEEGENVVFTLTRSGGNDLDAFTVRVNVYDVRDHLPWIHNEEKLAEFVELENLLNTGPRGTDGARSLYSENQYDVLFAAGSATADLTIATEDESYNDGNSYFRADIPLSANYQVDPFPGSAEVWVRDDDIPTVHVTPEELTVVEDGINIPEYTFHRTGDTSASLWVGFDRRSIVRWANRHIGSPTRGLEHVRRSIHPGSSSLALHEGLRATTPPDGRDVYVLLQPHYCETVPGDCGTASQYRVGSPSSSSIKLLNDAQAVRIEADRDSVTEGEAATFTLTRHGGTPQGREYALGVRVQVTQDGQFIDGVPPQTVRFSGHPVVPLAEASDTATLTIPTLDDDVYEAGGSIEVLVLPSTETAALLGQRIYEVSSPASASVTVADNDVPTVAVSDTSASEDAGTMQFTVSVAAAYGRLTVDWETSDGSGDDAATAGSDYEAASGQVVFNHGEAERTISVNITDDDDEEGNETFTVTLKNPDGLVLPTDPTATGTILDDDVITSGPAVGELPSGAEVTITAAESSVEEGEVASFTITRQQQVSGNQSDSSSGDPLNVSLALSQEGDFFSPSAANFSGATVAYDIASATVDVTIPAGQLSVTLNLATDDDGVAEADGSITLTVAEGTDYGVGTPAAATTNVTDNDVGISISDVTQDEGTTSMTFTVSLSRAADEAVTVEASTMDGTATSDVAVTATSLGKDFEAKTGTLTISAGDTEAEFTVTLLDDTIDEDAEEFTVVLSSPSDNAVLLDDSATGAIDDNDDPMMVGVHRAGRTVNENAEGPVVFRLQVMPEAGSTTTATEKTIEVRWTVLPGTATAGEDYVAVADPEKTEIPAGVTTRSVEVTLTDDSLFEVIEETFTFEIRSVVNAVENADHQFIEMTIRDDDAMRVNIGRAYSAVSEGDDAVFHVWLPSSVSTAPVEIEYQVFGTAGPTDYIAPSGTLTIPAGESRGVVAITTLMDDLFDPNERVGVSLTRATSVGRQIPVPASSPSITILDESVLAASIVSGGSAEEGDGVEFTIRLTMPTDLPVEFNWQTVELSRQHPAAVEGVDYQGVAPSSDSIPNGSIPKGATSTTFTVGTFEDNLYEGEEGFTGRLNWARRGTNPRTAVSVPLGVPSASATILDDDARPTEIALTAVPAGVSEGAGETTFTVTGTLAGSSRMINDVEVTLTLDGSVSEDEADDESTPVTLTIPAGQSIGTTTLSATPLDDGADGDDTTIRITGTADGFVVTPALVTVTDDDGPPTGVELTITPSTVGEGAGETELLVTGTLTGGGLRSADTQVDLSVEGVSIPSVVPDEASSVSAKDSDYSATNGTLTIPAGRRTGTTTVTFTPADDILVETSETAQVSGESEGLDVMAATLTIEDNDQKPDGILLSVSPDNVSEGDGVVELEVMAALTGDGARTENTTVLLTVEDVSAAADEDYVASPTELVIPAGQLSAATQVYMLVIDDQLGELTEQVAIRGTNDDPGLQVTGTRVSIADNDLAAIGITLSLDRSSIPESGGFQVLSVTGEISGNSLSTETVVSLAFVNGTAASSDYLAAANPLIIPASQKSGTSQIVVLPIDDQVAEGDETIEVRGSTSFRGQTVESAYVTITDDDSVGITITPTDLTIREGSSKDYEIVLTSEPSEEATVTVSGHENTDLTFTGLSASSTLTFTTSNWSTPQTVGIAVAQDSDNIDDTVTLTHTGAGGDYQGVFSDLSVTIDDDENRILIFPFYFEIEEGDSAGGTYAVKLANRPSETVTVAVSGQANTDLTFTGLTASSTLTFTTENWQTDQTVTVTADHDPDGTDDFVVISHTAAGGEYQGEEGPPLLILVKDDDRGILLSTTTLEVMEGDASGVTYTVELATQPNEEVTVTVSGQANTDLTLSGLTASSTLTFTTENWSTAQAVTVTAGPDHDTADEAVTLAHTASGGEYAGVSAELAVTAIDDDSAMLVLSTTTVEVMEGDATGGATYTVRLGTEPSATTTVVISGYADTDVSVDNATLTFTSDSWSTPQAVKVTAGPDHDTADDAVTLAHSASGAEYAGVSAALAVTVIDGDTASLVLSTTTIEVMEGAATGATYTVKLGTEPSATTTVVISGYADTDVSVDKATLTFTADSWSTPQAVKVTAGPDHDTADDAVTLAHTASGAEYAGVSAELAVTVIDDDTPELVLSTTTIEVMEGDETGATYTVRLGTEPSATTTVVISGYADADLNLSVESLTFTTSSWNTPQTVKVTAGHDLDGVDDAVNLTHTATGGNYAGETADLAVTVIDDDSASLVLSTTTVEVMEGDEPGATYTVRLGTEPSATTTVAISGYADTDLNLSVESLTFTTENWSTAQSVTVMAGDDHDTADDMVTLAHTASGAEYAGESAELAVTVIDDDSASLVLSTTTVEVMEGDETGATYTVKLGTEPSATTTVVISGYADTDVSVDNATLTFTSDSWSTPQAVKVTAGPDHDTADDAVTLTHSASGAEYAGVSAALAVTVIDGDTASLVLSTTTIEVMEGAATGATYTVRLATQPSATTTVVISGHSGTGVSVDKATLTFTADSWSTPQAVKVTAGPDHDTADDAVTLTHSASGAEYAGVSAALAVTVIDGDTASLVLSTTTIEVMEGAATGATYTVRLATQPSATTTVVISGHSGTGVSVDKATLTFTTDSWSTPQAVKVTAGPDHDTADDAVTLAHTASGAEYAGVSAELAVTVIDDDSASAGPEHDDDRGDGG